ncbi:MAG: 3-phosphoshikimate 1-carboxyvinyltransferase [Betaproteobacteria bacterium]|nr:3-phosphoshikimate 1-carboxyvinyltransferase [Betaproteobacteria bacterium]
MTDHIELQPAARLAGEMHLPGSKSITNRVLLLAALAQGETVLDGVLDSDDAKVMLDALRALGVGLDHLGGTRWRVQGVGRFPQKQADIFVGNSGLSIRTLAAALALSGGIYRLHGVPRMHERPIGDLVVALQEWGANIRSEQHAGYPPLLIGPPRAAALRSTWVKGDVSSQYLTGLLQAAPLAASGGDVCIKVQGELISKPYIEITLNLMQRFGVAVKREGWSRFTIPQGSAYTSPGTLAVEGDASSASYFLAAGVIGGGPVRVHGIGRDSIQGDARFADVLATMGGRITWSEQWVEASRDLQSPISAIDFDANEIPDAAMTLAVVALFADGTTTLRNIASWRVKETDRLAAMAAELRKLGAGVEEGADWIRVTPPVQWRQSVSGIDTYDDHRMAMCFSLASLSGRAIRINEPGCVAKTFPSYFEVFNSLVRPLR